MFTDFFRKFIFFPERRDRRSSIGNFRNYGVTNWEGFEAVVVTPTTGNPLLLKAVESVLSQQFKNVLHLIVVDGKHHEHKVKQMLDKYRGENIEIMTLPFPTGRDKFNGHRIYASIGYIVNISHIMLLDEDNWYEENHVESLLSLIKENNLDWAYSLRNICSSRGEFIVKDNCESLGPYDPYSGISYQLVDTNCYAFKREIYVEICHNWYHPLGADRILFNALKNSNTKYRSSKKYTVNYRLTEGRPPLPGFFHLGNEFMVKKFGDNLPWLC